MEVGLALGDGYLTIDAFPLDRQFRLKVGQRVQVEIAVSSGDRETAGLYRLYCPVREGLGTYDCFRFILVMRDGADLEALAGRAEAMGGRLVLAKVCSASGCWSTGHIGIVVLFSPDHLVSHARRARAWPGVDLVDLDWSGGCVETCSPLPLSALAAPVRAGTGAPVFGDGIVQARSGDTVVVTYRQPTGGTLTVRRPVP